jgi:hypothetical protein
MITAERIDEMRRLIKSGDSATLSTDELTWLFELQDELKLALRGLFETHVAIDPPERGPCPECLVAITLLDKLTDAGG